MSRPKNTTKVDLQLLQKFYDTQQKIFQEDSRHVVESFCRTEQLIQITHKASESLRKEKEHFEMTRNLISKSTKKKPTKEQTLTFINKTSIQNKTTKIPGLLELTMFVLNNIDTNPKTAKDKDKDNNDMLDLLTFSVVPSYLDFFWVGSSIEKSIKYFTLLSQDNSVSIDQYNQIARSVFVTPGFLLYSLYAFQPIFSKIFNFGEKNFNNFLKDNLSQSNLNHSISRYNYMIPKEVFIAIMCSKDPESTFFNSFLSIALSSASSMHIYNLLHFSQNPSKDFLKAVRSYICPDQNEKQILSLFISVMTNGNPFCEKLRSDIDNIMQKIKSKGVNELTSEINDTNRYQENDDEDIFENDSDSNNQDDESSFLSKHLFNTNDQKYCPEIFQPFFLSSHDLSLFQSFFNQTSYVPPNRLEYFRVFSIQEEKKDNVFSGAEQTMINGGNMPTPFLRHLLQLSDPLPKFQKVPSDATTFDDFINNYLVDRGDFRTYAQRKFNAEQFMFFAKSPRFTINYILKKVGFSRINDIMALSAFANIEKKLEFLDGNSKDSRESMFLILDSQKKEFSNFKDPHSDSDYFKTPKLFYEDFNSLTPRFRQFVSSTVNLNKIIYSKLMITQKIDFQTFVEYRTNRLRPKQNMKGLDQEFSLLVISNNTIEKYINENIPTKQKMEDPKFDKGIYLKRFIYTFELNYFNSGYKSKLNEHKDQVDELNRLGHLAYLENDYFECRYIGDMIIEAFQEKSLMRKIDILSRCFTKIKNELNKNFPPEKSPLAEPEFEPTICAIIMRVNPPNFYSNYVFLHDMVGPLSPEDIFVGSSRSIFHYFEVMINFVFNEKEKKIRSCMLYDENEDM